MPNAVPYYEELEVYAKDKNTKLASKTINDLFDKYPQDKKYKLLLLIGLYEDGYLLFHKEQMLAKYWLGGEFKNQSILLYASGGIEHILLTMRYLPLLYSLNFNEITIQVPTRWLKLFEQKFYFLYKITDKPYKESIKDSTYNHHCDMLSLPYIFKEDVNNLVKIPPILIDKNIILNKYLQVGIICNEDVSLNIRYETCKYKYTKDTNILELLEHISKLDIVVTDISIIAHICGNINKKCYFIAPVVSSFEWGLDIKNNTSIYYENVYIIRNNSNTKQVILDIEFDIKKISNKKEINKDYIKEYSFSQQAITSLDTNMSLYKKALVYFDKYNYQKSYEIVIKLIKHYPSSYEVNNLLSKLYQKESSIEKALHHILLALKNNPSDHDSYYELGHILSEQKKYKESLVQYNNAIVTDPTNVKYYNALAMVYQYKLKDNKKAIEVFDKCVEMCDCSKHEFIYYNIGIFYQMLESDDGLRRAITYFEKDIQINKNSAKSYNNMGNCYKDLFLYSEAIHCFNQAIKLDSLYDKSYSNLAIVYKQLNQVDKAFSLYSKGLEVSANDKHNIAWNISLTHLLNGEFSIGWEHYESRLKKLDFNVYCKNFNAHKIYKSQDITNKHIVIYYEQGFGDTIQFVRYLDLLDALNPRKITMITQHELIKLFSYSMPKYNFLPFGSPTPNDYDYHCALLSLPYIFGTKLDTIPDKIPYIFAKPYSKVENNYSFDETKTNVAIVHKSSDTALDSKFRDIDIEYFKPLKDIENVQLFSLQVGAFSNNYKTSSLKNDIIDLTPFVKDFSDSASIIKEIDVVICIDTAITHLCGALNTTCFLLLHKSASWRWLVDRSSSVWYNSVRIYRVNDDTYANQISLDLKTITTAKQNNKYVFHKTNTTLSTKSTPINIDKKYDELLRLSYDYFNKNDLSKSYQFAVRVLLRREDEHSLYILARIYKRRFQSSGNIFDLDCAISYYKKLLKYKKTFDILYALASLYYKKENDISDVYAIKTYEEALSCKNDDIKTLEYLSKLYEKLELFDKAVQTLERLVFLKPNTYIYIFTLGYIYNLDKKYEKSLKYYEKALEINKIKINTYIHIASSYKKSKLYKQALHYGEIGLEIEPNNKDILELIGASYKLTNQIQKARICYEKLSKKYVNDPTLGHNLAFLYLLQGDFQKGWIAQEKRKYFPAIKEISQRLDSDKLYKAQDLTNKTIVLHYEQGYGDMVQFSRFVKYVQQKKAKKIILAMRTSLVELFKCSFENDIVQVINGREIGNISYDYQALLMSIPYILNLDMTKITMDEAYIKSNIPSPVKLDKTKLNIGICWEANRKSTSYNERSVALNCFSSLLNIENTSFYSLQVGDGVSEIYQLGLQDKIQDISKHLTSFNHTTAFMDKLDLIISIDTVIAHLAGALNKPCLTLLPYNPNWRWLINSKTTFWYPNMQLFRQKKDIEYINLIQNDIFNIVEKQAKKYRKINK